MELASGATLPRGEEIMKEMSVEITHNGKTNSRYGFDVWPTLNIMALVEVCGVLVHCGFTCDNVLQTSRIVVITAI